MARTIAVANQKGGVGKTTTVINVAAYLADAGKRVLVVDDDPQGNTTTGLGVDKAQIDVSLYEVLVGGTPIQEALLPTSVVGLQLIPGALDLAGAEVELLQADDRLMRLRRVLEPIVPRYDYVFIDCPPSLGVLTMNALTAADSVMIPLQCEFFALEGLTQLWSTIEAVRERMNPGLELEGVVLTMYDGRTNLAHQVADEVRSHFRGKVFATVIPRTVRLSEAPSYGQPILRYDPRSKAAEVYGALAKEVMENDTKSRIRARTVSPDGR